jgi:uncharacterized protein YkwD
MSRTTTARSAPAGLVAALALALGLALSAAPAGADVAPCPHALEQASALAPADARAALLCLIDAERGARGLAAVAAEAHLGLAAQAYGERMVAGRFFDHVDPAGATLDDRVGASGYLRGARDWGLGEALGWATEPIASPAELVAMWLDSPPHRAILLDPGFREVGIGVAAGVPDPALGAAGATVVLDFGHRRLRPRPRHRVRPWPSRTTCAATARRSRRARARCG